MSDPAAPELTPGADAPWFPRPTLRDWIASVLLIGSAAWIVILLAGVEADGRGHGTHEQLGMEPCGWAAELGKPCPTCGVTTAATHIVHLHPLRAIATQPFGAALAVLGLFLAGVAGHCLIKGRSLGYRLRTWPYGRAFVWMTLLFFGSWAWKWVTWEAR